MKLLRLLWRLILMSMALGMMIWSHRLSYLSIPADRRLNALAISVLMLVILVLAMSSVYSAGNNRKRKP